jgi:hypothetical protein
LQTLKYELEIARVYQHSADRIYVTDRGRRGHRGRLLESMPAVRLRTAMTLPARAGGSHRNVTVREIRRIEISDFLYSRCRRRKQCASSGRTAI